MNGEVDGEKRQSVVGSTSDLRIDRVSDGGDDLSQYSSCGGESEMERYYSSSSAIGTPRVVAGTTFQNFDFGSSRSFKLGGESDVSVVVATNFVEDANGFNGVLIGDGNSENRDGELYPENVNEVLDNGEYLKNNRVEEDETYLSNEHSEGEDSMFGSASDNEGKIQYYYRKNELAHLLESGKTDNHLVMNSAAAFGSDDWDDFVHENKESSVAAMVWNGTQASNQSNQHNGIGSLGFLADLEAYSHSFLAENVAEAELASPKKDETTFEESKPVIFPGFTPSVNDDLEEHIECSIYSNEFEYKRGSLKGVAEREELEYVEAESEIRNQDTGASNIGSGSSNLKESTIECDPLFQLLQRNQNYSLVKNMGLGENESLEDDNASPVLQLLADTPQICMSNENVPKFDQENDHFMPIRTKDVELNGLYDEVVNDMHDVLLDSCESPQSGVTPGSRISQSQIFRPYRDGGSTSSTSGTDYAYNWIQKVPKIDRVEVVGVSQKKGDVSFSERLVGVQKHTCYKIKVWSGEDQWEIERRYRDFSSVYHRLKKSFADNGWTLPSPWSRVETESLKLFGSASPNVISDRSVLIQDCLQSIITSNICPNSLTSFLAPFEMSESDSKFSPHSFRNRGKVGNTISLLVHIQPSKSIKDMLDLQYYRCAGCHKSFDDGTSMVRGFVMALGWGKPRYCEYTGQLFCSSCHVNDTAVIPSKVLHCWDFTIYPVSQLAKSFLDSINDQPMLCVGAINPFLFSKVPTLQHVANIRNRIREILLYVQCPFRRSIYKSLGSRSYLLDSNDFFALRDLIDLSKGVFSVLAVMLESLSRKIQDHITDECLVCYDAGVPCNARQDCMNPLSLIFPFQEGDVEKCKFCEAILHKKCFNRLGSCSCGAKLKCDENNSGIVTGLLSKVLPSGSKQKKLQNGADISMASLLN